MADALSRLIEVDENIKLQPEEEGKEFGYFPFEELPPTTTQVVDEGGISASVQRIYRRFLKFAYVDVCVCVWRKSTHFW